MINKKQAIVLLAVIALALASILIFGRSFFAKSKIRFNKTSVCIQVDHTVKLSIKGTKKKAVWRSDNPDIATVSSKGVITGKSIGTTKVFARVSKRNLICSVKVVNAAAATTATPEPTPADVPTATPTANASPTVIPSANPSDTPTATPEPTPTGYNFRYPNRLTDHYKKHGIEMGFASEADYLRAANAVIVNPSALHALEADDNDHVYFVEATGEIVFLSQDGYIRTYFIADRAYFDRQTRKSAA